MTLTTKIAASVATLIALSAPAYANLADIEDFNVNAAKLDMSLDFDGNGDVDTDEIIRGNMAFFDTDGNGAIDADERGEAELVIES